MIPFSFILKWCIFVLVFTNVAATGDGGVYWEGLGEEPVQPVTSWKGQLWDECMLCFENYIKWIK